MNPEVTAPGHEPLYISSEATARTMGGILSHTPQPSVGASSSTSSPPRVPRSGSYLTYFNLMTTPDLTHTHTRPAGPATINAVARLLTCKGVPLEIAQRIVEDARYWSKCTRTNTKICTVNAGMEPPRQARGGQLERWTSGQESELKAEMEVDGSGLKDGKGRVWYLASSPIGCGRAVGGVVEDDMTVETESTTEEGTWIREIVVNTFSRDQGWSDNAAHYGTYTASYSWFELSLLRNGREVPDSRMRVQNNIHAGQYSKAHHNVLSHTHPLVAMAKEGDRVILWGRAEFPGWTNHIKEATISVYTAPFPIP